MYSCDIPNIYLCMSIFTKKVNIQCGIKNKKCINTLSKYRSAPSKTNMEQVESERSFIANEADESVIIDYPQRAAAAEGECEDFLSVDELQACGIGAVDIQKLKLAGICTIKVNKFSQ
jgi:hypothetical protein